MFVFEDLVGLADKGILDSDKLQAFKEYIVTQCTSTPTDLNWLIKVIFEWNETVRYNGYWRVDYDISTDGAISNVRAAIVLNVFFLRNLKQLKRSFAHEYGHHWTLSYYVVSQNIHDLNRARLPDEYYSKRGLPSFQK